MRNKAREGRPGDEQVRERKRERERGRDKTATAEDAQIQVHDCVAEREELRKEEPSVAAVAASA